MSWIVDNIKDVWSLPSPRPILLRLVIRAMLCKAGQTKIELLTVQAAKPDAMYRLSVAAVARDVMHHSEGCSRCRFRRAYRRN